MHLPTTYPEQSADHEFPAEVVELVHAAAGPGEVRRTWIEAVWLDQDQPIERATGRPVRTEGEPPRRRTYVAADALTFEAPQELVDHLILDLVPKLRERGYTVYGIRGALRELAPPDYARTWTSPSRPEMQILVVLQSRDSYEPIRVEGPGSGDVSTRELIQTLEDWKRVSSFEIITAHTRILDLYFRSLPDKLHAFAKAVYQFNPEAIYGIYLGDPVEGWDTLDYVRATNAQKPADLARSLKKSKKLRLFWE